MRRADRLFQIVQLLRRHPIITASTLSERLQVSERTIYRDIQDLSLSGVPLRGEAGVGYTLDKDFDLPPLMFTEDELQALALGAGMVREWGDSELAKAARNALDKIELVLPINLRGRVENSPLHALNWERVEKMMGILGDLRRAISDRHKVLFDYTTVAGVPSVRTVRPLGLAFTAPWWLMAGWCELRNDFRNFRVDRIATLEVQDARFEDEEGRTWNDFIRKVTARSTKS